MSVAPLGTVHWIADLDVGGDRLLPAARSLLEAGLPSLQLRAKGRSAEEIIAAGSTLRNVAARHGATFLVNGSVEAALDLEADGVHLPADGPSVGDVRERTPSGFLVGRSAHDARELQRAQSADWVFLSPVFATASKPGAHLLGLEGLRELAAASRPPVYALGGIDEKNAELCLEVGCSGVAAIRSLQSDDGPCIVRALR